MKKLWAYIDGKSWKEATKYRAALWILGIMSALAGFTVWMIVRTWVLSTPEWMICFIGYPVVISWYVVFFYSCRHSFHNGTAVK